MLSLGPTILADGLGQRISLVAGRTACVMFVAATGLQFALARLATRAHLALSSIAAMGSMTVLVLAITVWQSRDLFVAAAILAGAAKGLGQLAGFTLIATSVSNTRRAEANAALSIAGYIPAAVLPAATGYLIDVAGLTAAVSTFAAIFGLASFTALVGIRWTTARPQRFIV